jgi:hypothetical protein
VRQPDRGTSNVEAAPVDDGSGFRVCCERGREDPSGD